MLTHRPMISKADDVRQIINKSHDNITDSKRIFAAPYSNPNPVNMTDSVETFYSIDNEKSENWSKINCKESEKVKTNSIRFKQFGSYGDTPLSPSSSILESPKKNAGHAHQKLKNFPLAQTSPPLMKTLSEGEGDDQIDMLVSRDEERAARHDIKVAYNSEKFSAKNSPERLSENTPGSKFFEEFFLIGADNDQISKAEVISSNNNRTKTKFVEPRILYSFPQEAGKDKSTHNVLPQFALPFGIESKKIGITNSFSQLNEIIFTNHKSELKKSAFVFTMKTEESFKNQRHNHRILQLVNPNNYLYCICYVTKEYSEVGIKERKRPEFWSTKKVYGFITYYPLIEVFLEIISHMLDKLKLLRMEKHAWRLESDTFAEIDSDFFNKFMIKDVEDYLKKLYEEQLPVIETSFKIKSLNDPYNDIRFMMPSKVEAAYLEALWGAELVFSSIDLNSLVIIFLSILLENSVVFISSNVCLLTSTIMVMHAFLKPFKWPHPLIFNLPQNLIPILDSPVPILIGLNKDKAFFEELALYKLHPNIMFVVLEEKVEIYNMQSITNHIPDYIHWKLYRILEKIYRKENPIKVFLSINKFIEEEILRVFKSEDVTPKNNVKKVLDIEELGHKISKRSNNENQAGFLKLLCKSQILIYYLEQLYGFYE